MNQQKKYTQIKTIKNNFKENKNLVYHCKRELIFFSLNNELNTNFWSEIVLAANIVRGLYVHLVSIL